MASICIFISVFILLATGKDTKILSSSVNLIFLCYFGFKPFEGLLLGSYTLEIAVF